ncbi:TIGR01212 family radical SAM protein [Acetobacterium wieringae]|uniref:Coproporphyrinogen III oxidase n=1 Tax=Acetobacterium wieringae TaxID=52694 RepID=A0A1F2PDZ5_9FIRM|nr:MULTISPECIES: TIGR01212 family radical SAM protein [Acetobacterium]MEA4805147.1 TIGR01212 family radical SAM protein [Acetobacterium wieringae]OFV69629.1 coproporphyrinogen III oxidase [Acetobacterium wieringae]OXS26916.1 MAG: TIGR01212 family radical SAM protein [Acetobacterium sp. MES1]TYC84086.1 TIGR01212 family radical SAM protein [Acetobacterium wieringae]URN85816.1 TIGR01212 family radical SAM protein [Acetobacterium wieringae]
MTDYRYNIYSIWLKERYGEKVYKIPINIPVTCPNRDGTRGSGGCVYCGAKGGGNETLSDQLSVSEQLEKNIAYIGKRYHAKKFIAYFQSFSNTYCEFSDFKKWILAALRPDVVEISVSTRPDCITDEQLYFLETVKAEQGVEVTIELGLQSANEETLKIIKRGHTLADYEQAIDRIKAAGLLTCTHMILDLPWDSEADVISGAKLLSRKKTDFVKCHSLYIEKDTLLEQWYQDRKLTLLPKDDYITRGILFLEYLDPKIVVQRLIGRVPKEDSVITNWNTSWWKIKDELDARMEQENNYQGRKFSGKNKKR